ncbi:HAD family hydrolase [Anaerostipes sp.]|uniref:HAD family hydrolase n=1 Tax=Anaerostipes sp. TaxID=1872530 RepID=UPI0025BE9170|nr:HAD family hydrolase [Anaerostipes sp.]MBS7008089.1 HAD family hydrolase [Anaerostipes sp.]
MKKYKGIVFFDYDGTTVDDTDGINKATKKTIESLEKLKGNGYLTMLCSGRSRRFLENDIDKFEGAITCNGSYTEVGGQVVTDIHISEKTMQEVIRRYFSKDTALHLETQDVTYYMHYNQQFYRDFRDFLGFPDCWFAPWEDRKDEHITKIVINYEREELVDKLQSEFAEELQCVKPFEDLNILDIMSKGVTKGDAIVRLMDRLGVHKEDCYAFGDSDNDIEMLEAVGTAIVMGRHSKAAGRAADMLTGTVREEGITRALENIGLI